ncbi:MAG TPA: NAD kinase [Flavobacteriales bacterium]|nr:NAD kinase [Flavobacteriales bacterium]HRE73376.1 NAD kinase [Flavobacteriales bacterium]HRE95581.1 NAD kinase [Flavobacteriales bacterium]HRJ37066.1 NAD kinase [Flavobacteriales bacterium]HRJ38565.1 NAD kinase [Flavobacteriales bacterium]
MTIAIYGRSFSEEHIPHIQQLFDELAKRKAQLIVFEAFNSFLRPRINVGTEIKLFTRHSEIKNKAECLISIGGDGSIMDAVTIVKDSGIPILGINTGRLGFLSNISLEQISTAIENLFEKEYRIEKRALLRVETSNNIFGSTNFALNELTIHRKDSGSMITIHAQVEDHYLNSYWADGIIIATPTGSTAYSLSAGGPIVEPGSNNFVITPIAPHNLNVRPMIISDDNIIRLKVEGRSKHFLATLDSRSFNVDSQDELIIRKADFKIKLIKLQGQNFYETIRNKLMWGIDKRN